MAHAYFIAGGGEEGIEKALRFAEASLGVPGRSNPDIALLQYGLFSVEDARNLLTIAVAAPIGAHKVVIICALRLFHEAQNALLKLFEEPPSALTLILVVPSEGMLLATLRSRLAPLPEARAKGSSAALSEVGRSFIMASEAEREKMLAKLIERSKSDKDEEKQQARGDAVRLAEDVLCVAHRARSAGAPPKEARELRLLLEDLSRFLPLLHTRSAPLKLIFEHLLLVIPKGLKKGVV